MAEKSVLDQIKLWRPYVEAKLGFRNHWYPTLMSHEVKEGEPVEFKLLGESVLLNRVDGQVFCIRNRCLHRGVNFTARLECFEKGTVTCWYHGWTYKWDTGELVAILTNPESSQIGRHRIRVFPVEEAKGCLFVYVGDGEPHPLAHDVPPNFLDDDMVVFGQRRLVNSNWRLGVENGFDAGHIWIHKESRLVTENDMALPVGFAPPEGVTTTRLVDDDDGPKGVYDLLGEKAMPVFESYMGDEVVAEGHFGANQVPDHISIWLPGVLKVDPWPQRGLTQFEWYVPADEGTHHYFQTLGRKVSSDEEATQFEREFHDKWVDLALNGFNDDDIWAREAGEAFYSNDLGWLTERLYEPDIAIVEWRKFASKHNRGIQTPEHVFR
jgi:carbazole 1,9a-dioxygenase terminal dioxygenase component